MFRILVYKNQFTSIEEAQAHELSWEDFKEIFIRDAEVVASKGSEPQYFPGEMIADADSKGDSSVDKVHLYCLDADNITRDEYEEIVDTIKYEQLECIIHSTHSHYKQLQENGNYRIRAIFTLSRPVLAGEWRIFWSNCRLTFHSVADATTAHPSKHYLAASLPPGEAAKKARICREFSGKPIDVDEMLTRHGLQKLASAEVESFEIGKEPVSGNMFKELLARNRKGEQLKIANALKSALAKNAYAEEGLREATLFAIAGLLAHEFPRGNPDDICEPLRFSVEFEEAKGGPKYIEFKDKVIRRQRDLLQKAALKRMEAANEAAKEAAIKADATEFTEESLKSYIQSCGNKFKFKDLRNSLILVHKNCFYVFNGSGYVHSTQNSLLATIRGCLQFRAEANLDFSYYFPADAGKPPAPKTPDGFVKAHGAYIQEVKYTYLGASYYEKETQTLWISQTESPSRIVPERVPQVEVWMRAACPNDQTRKKWEQWMSQYANTNQALTGLVLHGSTGTGKSAFAEGMAKMHGNEAPCDLEHYLSAFNSQIVLNPLVFADESIPHVNGRVPTDKLRTLISSGKHGINRKGQPLATLVGFVRTIMAFQNLKKFDFGKGHTREDIEAISKRFLFVKVESAAAEFFDYDLFVTNRGLIKHAQYLAQTMTRSSDRFGVDTHSEDHVLAGDPVAMQVADWVIEYLMHKVYDAATAKPLNKRVSAFVNKGRLFVNVVMIRKEWDTYKTSERFTPTQGQISEAVRNLSEGGEPVRVRMGTGHESFWEINKNILRSRAEELYSISTQQLDLIFKIPHELFFKTKTFILSEEEKEIRALAIKEYKDQGDDAE